MAAPRVNLVEVAGIEPASENRPRLGYYMRSLCLMSPARSPQTGVRGLCLLDLSSLPETSQDGSPRYLTPVIRAVGTADGSEQLYAARANSGS
jgi:hypothetical protein